MSSFHHKGELLSQEGDLLRYRFYPDYFAEDLCSDILSVNIKTWEIEMIEESGHYLNDKSASALVYKIKKELLVCQNPPFTVYFIGWGTILKIMIKLFFKKYWLLLTLNFSILILLVFVYQAYWFLSCTTFSFMANEITLECFVKGKEKVVVLKGEEAQRFSYAWNSNSFSPILSALCHEPAFHITFHNSIKDTKLKNVCFKCNNFPAFGTLMGFSPNQNSNIMFIMNAHFPDLGFEKLLVEELTEEQKHTEWLKTKMGREWLNSKEGLDWQEFNRIKNENKNN